MKYCLNEKTGKLHIEKYCKNVNPAPKEYLRFATEEEAFSYGSLSICWCKLCQKKREQILKENK